MLKLDPRNPLQTATPKEDEDLATQQSYPGKKTQPTNLKQKRLRLFWSDPMSKRRNNADNNNDNDDASVNSHTEEPIIISTRQRSVLKITTQKDSLHHRYGKPNKRCLKLDNNSKCCCQQRNKYHHNHNNTRATKQRRTPTVVSFSHVTVYYHNTILGDNPFVSSGPPLALGNDCLYTEMEPVVSTPSGIANWSADHPLVIPERVRTTILLDAGVDMEEIRCMMVYIELHKRRLGLATRGDNWVWDD